MNRHTGFLMAALLLGTTGDSATASAPPPDLPDLICKIEVFRDEAQTTPVLGSEVAFAGGTPSVWISLAVRNRGGRTSDNYSGTFWFGMSVKNNGSRFAIPAAASGPMSLHMGYWYQRALVRVPLLSVTNKIEANAIADAGNLLTESNESNNTCRIVLTATVAH